MNLDILVNSTGTAISSLVAYKQSQINKKLEDILKEFENKQNKENKVLNKKIQEISTTICNFIEEKKEKDENLLNDLNTMIDNKNKILLENIQLKIEENNSPINEKLDNLINTIETIQAKVKKKKFF